MYSHSSTYRVRYADVDQMGYMYYGNYARLYEIGRVEALRALGVRYKEMEDQGIWMPVYENNSRYLKPAVYDDLLEITCKLESLPGTRIVFDCDIRNEEGLLLNVGKTTLVFLDGTTRKIMPCPEMIREKLLPHFAC
jgi:acyl-CoA thioester hydrolase